MGVNEIFITCITTAAYDSTQQWNLPVVVNTVNRSASQCAQSDSTLCTFSYSGSQTPILDIISPRAVLAKVDTYWWGNFRITNTNQISKMLAGSLLCDRYDLGLNEDTAYNGNAYDYLTCEVDYSHPAGFYPSTFLSVPGYATKTSRLTTVRPTTLDTPYDIQIVSEQTGSAPAQNITSQGGILTFNVANIPTNGTNTVVTWNNANCQILSAANGQLTCQLPAGLTNPAVSATPTNVQGSGALLSIYNTSSWDINALITSYRTNPTSLTLSQTIVQPNTEFIFESDEDGLNRQFVVFSGYFNPPRTGSYYFQTSTSYEANVYLQTTGSSTVQSTMTLINSITDGTDLRDPYSSDFDSQQSTSDSIAITLTQGQAYYFEIYALSSNAQSFHISTGVRIPSGTTGVVYPNSVGQVSRLRVNYQFTKEVANITYSDKTTATKNTFGINFVAPYGTTLKNSATTWVITSQLYNRDTPCSTISWHFANYNGIENTCTQSDVLDSTGTKIGTNWQLTFLYHRTVDVKPTFTYDSTQTNSPVWTVITPAGPNLSGTFRLKANGQYVQVNGSSDIPFNTQDWVINSALQTLLNTTNIASSRQGNFVDGAEWVFDFFGVYSAITLDPVAGEAKLVGEPGLATPTPIIDTLRSADNTQLYYSVIENELITQLSTQPYGSIQINGVNTLSSLTSQQLLVNVLTDANAVSYTAFTDDGVSTLSITGITANFSPVVGNFTISYNGNVCVITTQVSSTFTGSLSCTYPYKVAGTYKPVVFYSGNGYALSPTVTAPTTNPSITSLSSSTIYSYGGTTVVITGKYFPTSTSNLLSVTVGSVSATIVSVSNTQITVLTPGGLTGSTADVVITYNSLISNAQTLNVNNSGAITLTGIDITVASPVQKTLITVTGTNFGTDPTLLAAYLDAVDSNNNVTTLGKYQVNVVTASSTQVQILLGGGLPGNYQLRVAQIGIGSNNPSGAVNAIQYNILLNNFSINTSSAYGGAQLIITGSNFSTTLTDNQVLVVYAADNSEFCTITAATTTQLTCTLPSMIGHFPSGSTSQAYNVEVWGLLIAQAIAAPGSNLNSQITFNTALGLSVTAISNAYQIYNTQYSITGTSFPSTGISVIILGNESTAVTVVSITSTTVTYIAPNLPYGTYNVVLRQSTGDSSPLSFTLIEYVYNLTPSTKYTISAAGAEIAIQLSGSISTQTPIFKFNGVSATTVSYNGSTGQATVRLPATAVGSNYVFQSLRSSLVTLNKDGTLPWTTHSNKFTVVAASWQVTGVSVSGTSVTITGTGITSLKSAYLQYVINATQQVASSSISSQTSTSAVISFANAPAGTYTLYLLDASSNYPTISNSKVVINLSGLSSSAVTSSYAGGQTLTISGSGFETTNISQNQVTICGNQATVVSATSSSLVVSTPPAYTTASLSLYSFPADNTNALTGQIPIGNDPNGNAQYLDDGDLLFYYSNTITGSCYAGFNFDVSRVLLSKFQLYPRSLGVTDASAFFGSLFQGSNDGTNWNTLYTIGSDFHLGKNMYLISTLVSTTTDSTILANLQTAYQYFRVYDSTGNSGCQLVEIQLFGWKQSSVVESGTTLTCPVYVSVNNSSPSVTLTNKVVYDQSKTYIVSSVTPSYGSVAGGTSITIQLDRAPTGAVPTVTIDGVVCASPAVVGSTITCTTGAKSSTVASSLVITLNSQQAVNNGVLFYYGYLWSSSATWGNDFAPISGDLVYVNQGKNLIVDVAYVGVLNTVIVQNASLIFANDKNIHFEANNILVQTGNVIIGTVAAPVTGSVRITLHGNESDSQFPTVGNKGLSIFNGSIDIQGKPRAVTWTELSTTAKVGDTSIQVYLKATGFDWAVGEVIVIASTDFAHLHSERRTITSISNNGDGLTATIGFTEPLLVQHISVTGESYDSGAYKVNMRAEVGLLTRNVIFEGDDSSLSTSYGAHLMLHGSQASARIRHAEFTKTGQPAIIGRYPIHFHMVGDVTGSIVEGNAVHDSFARVLTIHATHYLQVKNNVGYNCAGHNIFLEDGIETNNVISENLMIGTKQVWSMLQSDITPASYWITNPLNTVINNRAGGGDFYGFWYEIKEHPDGPSARNDICPQGMALGQFKGNIAHSYDRFGLRIFVMTNLQYPCNPYRNDTNASPFVDNPSFTTTWSDFVSFRNYEDGVLAEEVGNMVFTNFTLLDNKEAGFNVYLTNRTDQEVILTNSLIVGKSISNAADDGEMTNSRGVITPRTDGFRVQNSHFANFDSTMTVFKSCSFCWHFKKWVQGGKLTKFSGITYENVSSNMIYWDNFRREIYQDLDGSLTKRGTPQWVTPSGVHLSGQTACSTTSAENTSWDNGLICSQQVVRIEFSNPVNYDELYNQALYVQPCQADGTAIGTTDDSTFYISKTVKIENAGDDLSHGYVGTFLTNQIFSVQWDSPLIDFTHFSVQLSPWHNGGTTAADTILLKFPYYDYRETWQNYQMIAGVNVQPYKNVTTTQDPTALANLLKLTCNHGDWYNDVTGRALYLCLNGSGRPKASTNQYLERTDLNALPCLLNCPLPPGQCVKDGVTRKLSSLSTWQGITLEGGTGDIINVAGNSTLYIPCPWEVVVDQDMTQFTQIIIEGNLRIDPAQSVSITAAGIWIRGGLFIAEGTTPGTAYTKNLVINLTGDTTAANQFVVDSNIDVGNKVILNTGNFTLHGVPPTTTATRLSLPVNVGASSITVDSVSGWSVGDNIVIAPTQLDATEHEPFTITAIAGNVVTLNSTTQYYHYGASGVTISESWGSVTQEMDLRAQVLHLSRNIKIVGAPVTAGTQVWGCRVVSYYWQKVADAAGNALPATQQTHLRGIITWNGVEMSNCGQANSIRGALDFLNCGSDASNQITSVVQNTAIHHCPGYCANIDTSNFITISNTNFYNGQPVLLRMNTVQNVTISNNNFVGALSRTYSYNTAGMLYDMTTSIYFLSSQDPTLFGIQISGNVVQGSQGPCIVLPHTSCSNVASISSTVGVFGNQVQTCLVGAIFKIIDAQQCQWAGRISVSRSTKGIMVNPTTAGGIIVENVVGAECDRSVILRFAHEGYRNIGQFQNSAVYGVAIATDPTAYDSAAKAKVCQNGSGTQNLVVTQGGEDVPLKTMPLSYDVICNSEVFDSSLYQTNVKYVRFRKTYTNANFSNCANNSMMVTHPSASDATAGTYNSGVTCSDCDTSAYFNFMSPNPSWVGWFGGCGLFTCTGPANVLNVDFTGDLFNGVPTTGVSFNSGIVNNKCTVQSGWNNAYSCTGNNYVQLEWESQAPDHNTRSTAPVMLTTADGTYSNKLNMFREWMWDGNEPMNERENRYLATALINTTYTVAYNGLNPYNILHRIQQRTNDAVGEPNIWVVFTLTYQIPQNIEISIDGGATISSYLPTDNIDLTTKTNICGANIYDWTTRTVQFVINGSANCLVRAQVLDTVRIQAKVVLTVSDFFSNGTNVSFLSAVASFLGITDYSRIKVVGATPITSRFLTTTGTSTATGFNLVFDITSPPSSASAATTFADLTSKAQKLKAAIDANSVPGLPSNTYYFTSYEVSVGSDSDGGIYGQNTSTTPISSSSSGSDSTLAIVLGVVIGLVVVTIAIVGYCAYKRYKQRKAIMVQHAEIDHSVENPAQNKETAKVFPLAIDPATIDPANDQLQEKANSSSAPFQF